MIRSKTYSGGLVIIHHHAHPSTTSASPATHRIELFIQRIRETNHVVPAQVIRGFLLQVVAGCRLVHTQAFVERIHYCKLKFTGIILEEVPGHRQIQDGYGLIKVGCLTYK